MRKWLFLFSLTFVVLCLFAGGAQPQDQGGNDGIYLEDSHIRTRLPHAAELEKEGKYREALEQYEYILENYPNEAYPSDKSENQFRSAADYVLERISKYGEEGLNTYRQKYDGAANALYRNGLRTREYSEFSEVVRHYFFATVTDEAVEQLARMLLEDGRVEEALYYWEKVERYYPDPDLGKAAYVARRALCYRLLGEKTLFDSLQGQFMDSSDSIVIFGRDMTMGEAWAELQSIPLAARVTGPSSASASSSEPYSLSQPSLVDKKIMGTRNEIRLWRDPYPYFDDDNALPEEYTGNNQIMLRAGGRRVPNAEQSNVFSQVLPSISRVDGQPSVVLNTGQEILAIDPENGRPFWVANRVEVSRPVGRNNPYAMYGNAALYPYFGVATASGLGFANVYAPGSEGEAAPNEIYAFELQYGRRLWSAQVQNDTGGVKSLLFPHPPVHSMGRVFAAGVVVKGNETEVYICGFDAESGEQLWKPIFVCSARAMSNPWGGRFGGSSSTLNAIPVLSASGGMVYVMTNLGVAAGVHSATGNISWLTKYSSGSAGQVNPQQWTNRVASSTMPSRPVVLNGVLYGLAMDSKLPISVNARSGEPQEVKWTAPRDSYFTSNRPGYTYLLGKVRGHLVFVCDAHVLCFNPLNPKMSPKLGGFDTKNLKEHVATFGAIHDGLIYVPTEHYLKIYNTQTWMLEEHQDATPWATSVSEVGKDTELVGNLAVSGPILVSAGQNVAMAFTDLSSFNRKYETRLAQSPPDPQILFQHAMELFNNRQFGAAEEGFNTVVTMLKGIRSPEELVSLRMRAGNELFALAMRQADDLVENALRPGASADADKIIATYQRAQGYAPDDQRWALASIRLADLYRTIDRPEQAVMLYQQLLERAPGEEYATRGRNRIRVRVGAFARQQINDLILRFERDVYVQAGVEARATKAFTDAGTEAGKLKAARAQYPNSLEAQSRLLAEVEESFGRRNWSETVNRGQTLLAYYPMLSSDTAAKMYLMLAQCFENLNRPDDLQLIGYRLSEEFEGATVQLGGNPIQVDVVVSHIEKVLSMQRAGVRMDLTKQPVTRPSLERDENSEILLGWQPLALDREQPRFPDGSVLVKNGSRLVRWSPSDDRVVWESPIPVGWIGIFYRTDWSEEERETITGVPVTRIYEDEPAAKAGVEEGDIITHVNGTPIDWENFRSEIFQYQPGDSVQLNINRGGKDVQLTMELGVRAPQFGPEIIGASLLGHNTLAVLWDGVVAGVNLESGSIRWKLQLDGLTPLKVLSDDQRVYVHCLDTEADEDGSQLSRLFCVDGLNGTMEWVRETSLITGSTSQDGVLNEEYLAAWGTRLIRKVRASLTRGGNNRLLEYGVQMLDGRTGGVLEHDDASNVQDFLGYTLDRSSGRFFYIVPNKQLHLRYFNLASTPGVNIAKGGTYPLNKLGSRRATARTDRAVLEAVDGQLLVGISPGNVMMYNSTTLEHLDTFELPDGFDFGQDWTKPFLLLNGRLFVYAQNYGRSSMVGLRNPYQDPDTGSGNRQEEARVFCFDAEAGSKAGIQYSSRLGMVYDDAVGLMAVVGDHLVVHLKGAVQDTIMDDVDWNGGPDQILPTREAGVDELRVLEVDTGLLVLSMRNESLQASGDMPQEDTIPTDVDLQVVNGQVWGSGTEGGLQFTTK